MEQFFSGESDIEFFQPVVKLYEEGYSLWEVHELAVPLDFFFVTEELFKLLLLDELCEDTVSFTEYLAELCSYCFEEGRVMSFGIWTLLPPEDLFRQPILHRLPEQTFFTALPVLVLPFDVIEILRYPVVAKRYSYFQAAVH